MASSPPPSPAASPSPSPHLSPTASQPCGVGWQGPATIQHVVFIVMANRAYSEVIGSPDAPYINHLASLCRLATGYQAVAHPAFPTTWPSPRGRPKG
ncbi:MAG: hypothetical protein M0T72_13445 [Candidatus Dormibacteraeota bacterium]|nr:hypothetical protein [Candidatus Dormibacteraeota bacterium]